MTESPVRSRWVQGFYLTVVIAVVWVICFWPARQLRGESGVWWMSLAAISCLVPGWIVVFLSGLAILRNELTSLMLQTMVRLFIVAGVALFVRKVYPAVGFVDFFGWLLVFYLTALALEVWFSNGKRSAAGRK